MKFDPADLDHWFKVTHTQIMEKKGAGLLARYKGSLRRALTHTFPDLKGSFFFTLRGCAMLLCFMWHLVWVACLEEISFSPVQINTEWRVIGWIYETVDNSSMNSPRRRD